MVLNRVARTVQVLTYRGYAVQTINNAARKQARLKVGLAHVRVHDRKHTFGHGLRAARVCRSKHARCYSVAANGDITMHYPAQSLIIDANQRHFDTKTTQAALQRP